MKAIAAILGAAMAVCAAWLALPHVLNRGEPESGARPRAPDAAPSPSKPLDVPLPPAEQTRQNLDRQRLPFYRILRDRCNDTVLRFGVTGDLDTLDLVLVRADTAAIGALISSVIAPNARTYGFRRVRFYVQSPPGSVDPLTLIAEASRSDDQGAWTIWRK